MKKVCITDPIYGFIDIPPYCMQYIDTPTFQRLRRIKQLGMVEYIFPSATNTRFEHCIGVMHISSVFFTNLIGEIPEYQMYKPYKKYIEIAGLLHDLGHGPKSHLFEEAQKFKGVKFCHEEQGIKLLKMINDDVPDPLNPEELELVINIMLGIPLNNYPPFLFEIVNNKDSGLDTDKMDYLKRDAYFTNRNTIDINYIIRKTRIDKNGHVSYYYKTRENITGLFIMRKNMYKSVYFHETVAKIDKIMLCALLQLNFDVNDLEKYITYDDEYIGFMIRHKLQHDVIKCLDNRDLNHICDKCPDVRLERTAKLSSNTDDDPLLHIRFYDEA